MTLICTIASASAGFPDGVEIGRCRRDQFRATVG
jgi:hypothetical protein